MAKFIAPCNRVIGTGANDTIGSYVNDVGAVAPRRLKLYHWAFGFSTTPADAAIVLRGRLCTDEGTNTDVVPRPVDPADLTSVCDAGENHTVVPTAIAAEPFLEVGIHQRACPIFWYAPPDGDIVAPAAAGDGFSIDTPVISSGTPTGYFNFHVAE